MSAIEPILVSINDAAAMINCCRASFYKLINTGEIRAKKQGSRTLIPVSELHRYAASLPDMTPTLPS
jgi:excisionase family DNA binding protein